MHLVGFRFKNKKIFPCACLSVASGCACWLHIFLFTVGITIMFAKDQNKNRWLSSDMWLDQFRNSPVWDCKWSLTFLWHKADYVIGVILDCDNRINFQFRRNSLWQVIQFSLKGWPGSMVADRLTWRFVLLSFDFWCKPDSRTRASDQKDIKRDIKLLVSLCRCKS